MIKFLCQIFKTLFPSIISDIKYQILTLLKNKGTLELVFEEKSKK